MKVISFTVSRAYLKFGKKNKKQKTCAFKTLNTRTKTLKATEFVNK